MSGIRKTQKSLAKEVGIQSLADHLSSYTHFTMDECIALLHTHNQLVQHSKLERGKFREFLFTCFDITNDLMLDLTFRSFDRNSDGVVDGVEFVEGLSRMLRGSIDEVIEFCYYVFDMNGDGSLAREELTQCLKGSLQPGYGLEPEEIEDSEREIVEIGLKKLDFNRDGQITFDDYKKSVQADPLLLTACGDCMPSHISIARFLYLITMDYQAFTGPLLGIGRNDKRLGKQYSAAKSISGAGRRFKSETQAQNASRKRMTLANLVIP